MTTPLEHVAALARIRRKFDEYYQRDYRRSVTAARDAGCTLQAIADAAGVTKQAVHAMLKKEKP